MAHRINGRRVHHFGSEVAKLRGLYIAQFINGIGSGNHTRVGSHEAVHIRPDFQRIGIQCRSYNGSRIVGAAATEVSDLARNLVRRDKSRNQYAFRHIPECLTYQRGSEFRIQHMLGMLLLRFDEPARIKPFSTRQLRGNNG